MWQLDEELSDDNLEHLVADGGENLAVVLESEGGEDGGEVVPELEEKLCGDDGVWARAEALGRGRRLGFWSGLELREEETSVSKHH
jgi:hypothetical protein